MTAGRGASAGASGAGELFLAVKVGGSLFSDKHGRRAVDPHKVDGYAARIADLSRSAPGRMAFISGGGSFGHGAVRELDAGDEFAALALTEATFALKWIWARALRSAGVLAVPLQLTAMCALASDGLLTEGLALRRVLQMGAVPVLSGDCIVAPGGSLQVFSSDRVAEVVMAAVPGPLRVVTLTDVPGVIARSADGVRVIRHIDPDRPHEAYQALWHPERPDTTGAMAGKLDALIGLSRRGAECFVLGGGAVESLRFLMDPVESWPKGLVFTRIARPPDAEGRPGGGEQSR